ncbi:HEAT repeat domain-containing protein [Phormidium sp. FACHB-592]|uniref:HEAT repeat domain-containing protein n=1 Tax=Stenomitos frigidus AS-A4 TaxID=2933935 RepID=A0ABV0KQU1_9CYAN|nr:HEAT repeat domain-containing protein [Phormidium sp. FACHB-592]MBD2073474.1 HEAT repeat domain-containing protein [Phormidium sp. FACHB-592]
MSITPESVGVLLESSDFGDRLRAVNQIRQLEPSIGFKLIQVAIQDSNPRVRYAAVSQLSTLGQQDLPQVATILRERLHDEETDVQAAAADSIGALQLTEVFDDLQQLYHTTSEWLVKFSIVATLGELGDNRAFGLLEEALKSDNELLQTAAIGSLGELGDDRAIQLLIPFATNPDWQIRYRVVQALAHLDHATGQATLETLAQDDMEQVAQEARNYLKK